MTGFYGDPLTVLNPTKTGFVFSGWNPSLPSTITSDQTFSAERNQNTYTWTFNLNGGTGTSSLTGFYGDPLTVLNPTKTGFVFSGWNPSLPSTITSDQTFNAERNQNTYTWTFNLNGGTGSSSLTGFYGDPLTVPNPTKTGFVFSGWNPSLPSTITSDQTFSAIWNAHVSPIPTTPIS